MIKKSYNTNLRSLLLNLNTVITTAQSQSSETHTQTYYSILRTAEVLNERQDNQTSIYCSLTDCQYLHSPCVKPTSGHQHSYGN